jgi:hypothetical protein
MIRGKPRASNHADAGAKELRSLLSSLAAIRILQYIAGQPLDASRLRERLHANGHLATASLHRTLLRLRRQGMTTLKGSAHVLTPAGRKALGLAISGLKNIVAITRRRHRNHSAI